MLPTLNYPLDPPVPLEAQLPSQTMDLKASSQEKKYAIRNDGNEEA
jgi:hypothetical protein